MLRNFLLLFITFQFTSEYVFCQEKPDRNTIYDHNFQLFQEVLEKRYSLGKSKIYVYNNMDDYYLRQYKKNKLFTDSLKKYFKKAFDYPLLEASCCDEWTKSYDFKEMDSVVFISKIKTDDFLFENDSLYKVGKIKKKNDVVCVYPIVFKITKSKKVSLLYSIVMSTIKQDDNCDMYKGRKGYVDLYVWKKYKWEFITVLDNW